jgi:hypothetical protein
VETHSGISCICLFVTIKLYLPFIFLLSSSYSDYGRRDDYSKSRYKDDRNSKYKDLDQPREDRDYRDYRDKDRDRDQDRERDNRDKDRGERDRDNRDKDTRDRRDRDRGERDERDSKKRRRGMLYTTLHPYSHSLTEYCMFA